jgi:hypothetical protein
MMESIGSFVANPFGLGDAGYGFLDQLGEQLGLSNKKQVAEGQASLDSLLAEANQVGQRNRALYGDYLGQAQSMYGGNADKYNTALANYEAAIGNGPDTFTYQQDINSFYDKFANQRADAAMQALRNQGGQNLFSSDFMNNMAAKQQALASEEWSKAYDKMMQDRQQQLAEWQAGQASKQNYIGNLGNVTNLYGNDRNQLFNAMGDYYSNMASQNNADLQTKSDLTQAKTNLAMQQNSGAGALLGGVGKVLGGIFGA